MSKADKEARLAAALRENLKKRKAGASNAPASAASQDSSADEEKKN